jgi:hypothetical protein
MQVADTGDRERFYDDQTSNLFLSGDLDQNLSGSRRKKRAHMVVDIENEDDETKIMRTGSLGRILASGNSVDDRNRMMQMMHPTQAHAGITSNGYFPDVSMSSASGVSDSSIPLGSDSSTSSVLSSASTVAYGSANEAALFALTDQPDQQISSQQKAAKTNRKKVSHSKHSAANSLQQMAPLKASMTFTKIVEAFNQSDLDALAYLMRNCCHQNCELRSNVLGLKQVVRGRRDVMIFWALQMETYPDGIWICTKSAAKGMTITREFKFSGTRLFRRPTNELMEQVRQQEAILLDRNKTSYEIDEISSIMQSCWVSPVVTNPDAYHLPLLNYLVTDESNSARSDTSNSSNGSSSSMASASAARPSLLTRRNAQYVPTEVNSLFVNTSPAIPLVVPMHQATQVLPQRPTTAPAQSSLKSATALAHAIKEQGNVVNVERGLALTFNSAQYIIRIDATGDL